MRPRTAERAARACYTTWSPSYYDDYYGPAASYPPVHVALLRRLLTEAKVRSVLDAGCGPASILRQLASAGLDVYGFDVTAEMVREAQRVLEARGVGRQRIWKGSVLSRRAFRRPAPRAAFDAAICIGVLPHGPRRSDPTVLANLRRAVKPGGLVVVEARNQLFALFSLNRYSCEFFLEELLPLERLKRGGGAAANRVDRCIRELKRRFRMDLPPPRTGTRTRPGYDAILSRTHNPLVLKEQFAAAGFVNVRVLFYHFHCLPPMFESAMPALFREASLELENPVDWRGHFMASAFLVAGTRG